MPCALEALDHVGHRLEPARVVSSSALRRLCRPFPGQMESTVGNVAEDEAWARSILSRYQEIKDGHCWQPPGWKYWQLHYFAGHHDFDTVHVFLNCIAGPLEGTGYLVAYRVSLEELDTSVYSGITGLVFDDARGEELRRYPPYTTPSILADKLKDDLASSALRRFNDAAFKLLASDQGFRTGVVFRREGRPGVRR